MTASSTRTAKIRERQKAPTNRDVAKRAGVSVATVSRVLNGSAGVREGVRAKVMHAIKSLDYQPSRTAQRLRAKRGYVIGLVISDIQNPFFIAIVRGIEDAANQKGYSLLLCNSDEDAEKERQYLSVLRAESAAGVILASTARVNPNVGALLADGIPVVAIDRRISRPAVDSVVVDNQRGAHEAVSHLIAQGHTRIGFIGISKNIVTGQERRAGYLAGDDVL